MRKIDAASLLDDFESEARIHIETIESAFLDVDALLSGRTLMDGVFRAAHSLKGTAGFFSLNKIVELAHELESIFSRIKEGQLAVDEDIADVVLQSVDGLKELVNHLKTPEAVDIEAVLQLMEKYAAAPPRTEGQAAVSAEGMSGGAVKALKSAAKRGHWAYDIQLHFTQEDSKYFGHARELTGDILSVGAIAEAFIDGEAAEVLSGDGLAAQITDRVRERGEVSLHFLVTSVLEPELFLIAVELDERSVQLLPREAILGEKEPAPQDRNSPGAEKSLSGLSAEAGKAPLQLQRPKEDFAIRLEVSVVNELMNLANEMILTRNQLLSSVSGHTKSIAGLVPILHDMNRLTGEIQEKVMRTRMQPISVIFGKFPRMIRDTAKSLNKDIRVELSGGSTALDKYLLDALSDPIAQIVRNAAGHGVESAERREALQKPPKGLIKLNAYMRESSAIIEVSDDGAGIDIPALRQKSMERGLVSSERLDAMSRSELLALIFEPGLSTAKHITSLSGRGVGMDIVKTNIEKLGGSIEIESEKDKGTTIRLKMPLTLSVIRTLIIQINSVRYAVAESNVERIVRISGSTPARRLERINNALVLKLDGWILPAVTLEAIDAKARGLPFTSAQFFLERLRGQAVIKCLVLQSAQQYFALLIDDAIETVETLIQPLPIYLRRCRCYSSVMVLGSGNAAMILDAEGILRLMGIDGAAKKAAPDKETGIKIKRQVIIFQCAGKEYFALDMDQLLRIERIDPGHIQEVGGGQFVNIAGRSVQVIRPDAYAPVPRQEYQSARLYLLVLQTAGPSAGFLVKRVLNKVEDAFEAAGGCLEGEYICKTAAYEEKILIFLDVERILRDACACRQRDSLPYRISGLEYEGGETDEGI